MAPGQRNILWLLQEVYHAITLARNLMLGFQGDATRPLGQGWGLKPHLRSAGVELGRRQWLDAASLQAWKSRNAVKPNGLQPCLAPLEVRVTEGLAGVWRREAWDCPPAGGASGRPSPPTGGVGLALDHALAVRGASEAGISLRIPLGLVARFAAVPADNPLTAAKIALGKQLFWDPRWSTTGAVACVSCHQPEHG